MIARKKPKLTETQIIRALRRLEKGWPKDFFLFVQCGGDGIKLARITDDPDQDEEIENFSISASAGEFNRTDCR